MPWGPDGTPTIESSDQCLTHFRDGPVWVQDKIEYRILQTSTCFTSPMNPVWSCDSYKYCLERLITDINFINRLTQLSALSDDKNKQGYLCKEHWELQGVSDAPEQMSICVHTWIIIGNVFVDFLRFWINQQYNSVLFSKKNLDLENVGPSRASMHLNACLPKAFLLGGFSDLQISRQKLLSFMDNLWNTGRLAHL